MSNYDTKFCQNPFSFENEPCGQNNKHDFAISRSRYTLYKERVIKQTFLALLALFNWNYSPIAPLRQQNLKSWYSAIKHHKSFRKNMIKKVQIFCFVRSFKVPLRKTDLASNRVPWQHRRRLNLTPSFLSWHYLHFLLHRPLITVACTGLQISSSPLSTTLSSSLPLWSTILPRLILEYFTKWIAQSLPLTLFIIQLDVTMNWAL